MAVKFPLKMSGAEVRTIEELQKNFDLNAVVEYYKNGKLLRWLEDRYYDEAAEKLESLDANASDFKQQLCEALGVDYDESAAINEKRLKEKQEFLQQFTSEDSIINNAAQTAIHQEDLADLLDAGTPKIYLYGGSVFNVPIRITNKHYIGILGTPTINIRAKSQADLDAKSISFENVNLPWTTATISTKKEDKKEYQPVNQDSTSSVKEELKALASRIFGTNGEWPIVDESFNVVSSYESLSKAEKSMAINICCQRKYKEADIVFMMIRDDMSDGFAFTTEAFCSGGTSGGNILKYNEIKEVNISEGTFNILDVCYLGIKKGNDKYIVLGDIDVEELMFWNNEGLIKKVKKFLDVVKNLQASDQAENHSMGINDPVANTLSFFC